MELISKLLLVFIKSMALLMGIALLIGGGLCSVSIPFSGMTKDTTATTWMILITLAVVGLLIFLSIKLSFLEQAKHLALLIGGLFLVGGGLCSVNSQSQAVTGLLLINIALALSGYVLVRWIIKSFKQSPPSNHL